MTLVFGESMNLVTDTGSCCSQNSSLSQILSSMVMGQLHFNGRHWIMDSIISICAWFWPQCCLLTVTIYAVVDKCRNNLLYTHISALEFASVTLFFVGTHINVKSEVECRNYGREFLLVMAKCVACAAGKSCRNCKLSNFFNFLI